MSEIRGRLVLARLFHRATVRWPSPAMQPARLPPSVKMLFGAVALGGTIVLLVIAVTFTPMGALVFRKLKISEPLPLAPTVAYFTSCANIEFRVLFDMRGVEVFYAKAGDGDPHFLDSCKYGKERLVSPIYLSE